MGRVQATTSRDQMVRFSGGEKETNRGREHGSKRVEKGDAFFKLPWRRATKWCVSANTKRIDMEGAWWRALLSSRTYSIQLLDGVPILRLEHVVNAPEQRHSAQILLLLS